jgi:hypothetical protein
VLKESLRVELTRILAGPIQDGGDMQLFEIRDIEGHLIENLQRTAAARMKERDVLR